MTNVRRSKRATSDASSNAPRAAASTFDERLRASWKKLFAGREKSAPGLDAVLVACSGGSDSAAALLLARRMLPQAALTACYVDHGLRSAAAVRRDIAAVKAQAAVACARVHLEKVACRKRPGTSPEEEARTRRYEALERAARSLQAAYVVTGHHGDDVAETVLLALMRGSGLDGLAAMRDRRPLSPSVTLLRPFLGFGKEDLRHVAQASGVPTSHDETNDDMRFRRNAVRRTLAQLKRASPNVVRAIARSAALLTEERTLLGGLTARAWQRCRSERAAGTDRAALSTRRLRELPRPLLRRVIRHAVRQSSGSLRNFSLEHCDAIAFAIESARGGTYHAGNAAVHLSAGALWIEDSQPMTGTEQVKLDVQLAHSVSAAAQRIPTPLGTIEILPHSKRDDHAEDTETVGQRQFLDSAAIGDSPLQLRTPRRGDRCVPSGRHRPVSLARFLSKAGVPRMRRSETVLLCADSQIAAVLGLRVMEPFTARDGEPRVEVRWHRTLPGPILKQGLRRPKTSPNRSDYVR